MVEPRARPLASFDPRFPELLLRGSREAFTITCATPSEARRLQMRVQQYRKRALDADLPGAEKFYDCLVSLKKKSCLVTFKPRTSEFGDLLDKTKAGEPAKLESDPLAALEAGVDPKPK